MSLIVQDSTGEVANANAYISLADAKALFTERGLDYSAYSDADISASIINATEYIDMRFSFAGNRLAEDQTTEFPRYSEDGEDDLNAYIVKACGLYAFEALSSSLWRTESEIDEARVSSRTESVKDASESVTYATNKTAEYRTFTLIDSLVKKSGFTASAGSILLTRI